MWHTMKSLLCRQKSDETEYTSPSEKKGEGKGEGSGE
jgi:hypothetical protein